MSLIKIINRKVLPLPAVWRLVLKLIYDYKNMSVAEETQMRESIKHWKNHIEYKSEIGLDAVNEEHKMMLEIIRGHIQQDMDGSLEKRKRMFRQHNINYKKFYRLPEAYKKEDFVHGEKVLQEHMKTNPEDYN